MSSVTFLRNSLFVSAAIVAATSSLTDHAAAAPDDTLGMALMSATVDGGGTLVRGSGAKSVTRPFAGAYDVVFDRDLSNCSCTVSTGRYGNGGADLGTSAAANCPFAANNTVHVHTQIHDGTALDLDFHLIVFCPK